MQQRITSNKQLAIGLSWIVACAVLSYCLLLNHQLSLVLVYNQFLTFNSVLMGFVLTSLTITGSILGAPLVKELQKVGAYYSLMSNFYYLIVLLFFNSVIGLIFLLRPFHYFWLDWFILVDMSVLFVLFWYAISRLARILRQLGS